MFQQTTILEYFSLLLRPLQKRVNYGNLTHRESSMTFLVLPLCYRHYSNRKAELDAKLNWFSLASLFGIFHYLEFCRFDWASSRHFSKNNFSRLRFFFLHELKRFCASQHILSPCLLLSFQLSMISKNSEGNDYLSGWFADSWACPQR